METPVIADTVSHYAVLKKLGAGGRRKVYLAEDTALNRKIVIKFLPETLRLTSKRSGVLFGKHRQQPGWTTQTSAQYIREAKKQAAASSSCQYLEGSALQRKLTTTK